MATILSSIDFTDVDCKEAVKRDGDDWVIGTDNVYLYKCDQYYQKLLRDYGIASDDVNLADPVPFEVTEVLVCYGKILIYTDLIQDSRTPFETQEILLDKYKDKLAEAKKCLEQWLIDLDKNAFYGTEKSNETSAIGRFGRG